MLARVAGTAVGLAVLASSLVACGGTSAENAAKMRLADSIKASLDADNYRATSAPSAPVEQSFLDRANAICQPVLSYNTAHPNPYPSFDYNNPDVATLKLEGAYFSASPYADAVTKLVALGSPSQNATSWLTLTKTAVALRDRVTAQAAAAVAGDVTAFQATLSPISQLSYTVAVDAHQAGFAVSAPCQVMLPGG